MEPSKQVSPSLSFVQNNDVEGILRIYQEAKSTLVTNTPGIVSSNQGYSRSITLCISNDSSRDHTTNHIGGKLRFF